MNNLRFALPIAMVMALVPLALDLYLPAMPAMALDFNVGADDIATTISLFVLGVALGQLVGGPLSDRLGRRTVILSGLLAFSASSLVIMMADALWVAQLARFAQAIGGGFTAVCIPALIRDRAVGVEAAKLFSLVGLIMIAVPALAPSVGALILQLSDWRSIFAVLSIAAVLMMLIIWRVLPRRGPAVDPVATPTPVLKRYLHVLRQRNARRYLATQALAFSVMVVFITNASFIYQAYFGVSERTFGLLFAANIVMLAVLNRINSWQLNVRSPETMLNLALCLQLAAVATLVSTLAFDPPLWLVAGCIIVTVGSHGMIVPNSGALYMSCFDRHTGSASAFLGASQYLLAGLAGGLSTLLHNDTLWPVALIMLSLSFAANIILGKGQPADDEQLEVEVSAP